MCSRTDSRLNQVKSHVCKEKLFQSKVSSGRTIASQICPAQISKADLWFRRQIRLILQTRPNPMWHFYTSIKAKTTLRVHSTYGLHFMKNQHFGLVSASPRPNPTFPNPTFTATRATPPGIFYIFRSFVRVSASPSVCRPCIVRLWELFPFPKAAF